MEKSARYKWLKRFINTLGNMTVVLKKWKLESRNVFVYQTFPLAACVSLCAPTRFEAGSRGGLKLSGSGFSTDDARDDHHEAGGVAERSAQVFDQEKKKKKEMEGYKILKATRQKDEENVKMELVMTLMETSNERRVMYRLTEKKKHQQPKKQTTITLYRREQDNSLW